MALSRREFLAQSGSCAAHLAFLAGALPAAARLRWPGESFGDVVAREPFGSLEKIADGVWALVSTPLSGDRTTLSNGGIVAGSGAVLAIEGFNQPHGAVWLAGQARALTGRWPTHVVITHYHADHANGVAGYFGSADHPALRATERTRDLVLERNQPADASRSSALHDAELLSPSETTMLDLGGRRVRVVPRVGHTESDLSVELDDPAVVFCGDLFWNAMFPNFVDAIPSKLSASVRALRRQEETIYVPGHGRVGRAADYDRYVKMLDEMELSARKAHSAGVPPADAARGFTLPASLGEWTLFNASFYQRAFEAWYRDLSGASDNLRDFIGVSDRPRLQHSIVSRRT